MEFSDQSAGSGLAAGAAGGSQHVGLSRPQNGGLFVVQPAPQVLGYRAAESGAALGASAGSRAPAGALRRDRGDHEPKPGPSGSGALRSVDWRRLRALQHRKLSPGRWRPVGRPSAAAGAPRTRHALNYSPIGSHLPRALQLSQPT